MMGPAVLKKTAKHPTSVSLDPRLRKRMEACARAREMSLSAWIQQVCILAVAADAGREKLLLATTPQGLEAALRASVK